MTDPHVQRPLQTLPQPGEVREQLAHRLREIRLLRRLLRLAEAAYAEEDRRRSSAEQKAARVAQLCAEARKLGYVLKTAAELEREKSATDAASPSQPAPTVEVTHD